MASKYSLLFVDDEPNILSALRRVFFEEDYEIITSSSGEEALAYLKENSVQLIVTDQRMPGMSGTRFLREARDLSPDAIRIMLTGYGDVNAAIEAINEGRIYRFILKPWNDEDFKLTIQRALEYYDLNRDNELLLAELMKKNAELEGWNRTLNQKVKERTSIIVQRNLELGRMTKSLENSIVATIKVFINLIEMTAPDISRKARRVAIIATTLATRMNYKESEIRDVEVASLLKDIGKLGLPRNVLDKPESSRSESERKTVNEHPVISQRLLAGIPSFARVGKIIRNHHEHWDGTGFPDKLRKETIPMEARLIAVCSKYDDLLQEGRERSITFITRYFENNAGTRFDPEICGVLLDFVEKQHEDEEESVKLVEVMPYELKPGMELMNDLATEKGLFLLPRGQILDAKHITTIQEIHRVDPINEGIPVKVPSGQSI